MWGNNYILMKTIFNRDISKPDFNSVKRLLTRPITEGFGKSIPKWKDDIAFCGIKNDLVVKKAWWPGYIPSTNTTGQIA